MTSFFCHVLPERSRFGLNELLGRMLAHMHGLWPNQSMELLYRALGPNARG